MSASSSFEVIARYQPVASDLRYIEACLDISYGFSRFGRYAYDISEVMDMFGDLSGCDHSIVEIAAKTTKEMIRMSIDAFANKDVELAKNIEKLDDFVDEKYRMHVKSYDRRNCPECEVCDFNDSDSKVPGKDSRSFFIHRRICCIHRYWRKSSEKVAKPAVLESWAPEVSSDPVRTSLSFLGSTPVFCIEKIQCEASPFRRD